jgi:single-stranded-DNA-specific exonuclease
MKILYKQEVNSSQKVTNKELIDLLLKNRGVKDIEMFLSPPSPRTFSLKDFGFDKEIIEKTVGILRTIKEKGQTIVVYTDYDADGITGGSILWETLHLLGFNVFPYVPHRQHEGYGFSVKGIDNVKKQYDPALIISVDHGITGVDQIAYAKSIGIPVIVTDHHHKQERIPEDAEAIFHIPALSGSGAAYFFSKELFEHFKNDHSLRESARRELEHHFAVDYLALASIGTIADLVPLVGPSRSVVKHGLEAFSQINRKGIKSILRESAIDNKEITPYDIGFVIAPRINAIGRLEHAIDALRLLCTTNAERADELASKVGGKNKERQDLVKESVEEAVQQVEKMKEQGELPKLLILHSPNWHEGIIGLIASKIVEKYYRPTLVMTESNGQLKGSARSIVTFHMTEFLTTMKKYLLNFGGHKQAAGFTLSKEKLDNFVKAAVNKANELVKEEDLEKLLEVDLNLSITNVSLSLAKEIEKLQPFGIGNAQPTFVSEVELFNAQLFGKKNDHVKIFVKDPEVTGFPLELIAFGKADIFDTLSTGQRMKIVYQLEVNSWNGRENLRGKLIHIDLPVSS